MTLVTGKKKISKNVQLPGVFPLNNVPEWTSLLTIGFKSLVDVLTGNNNLKNEVKRLKAMIDDSEQRSRNECLVNINEDTDDFVTLQIDQKKLGIQLTNTDIKNSRRLSAWQRDYKPLATFNNISSFVHP